jgi:hypothetical protein
MLYWQAERGGYMSFPWFRFYTEAIHDRKLQRVGTMAGLSHCEAVGAWAILLALANDSPGDLRGWLYVAPGYPLGLSDLAKAWVVDEPRATKILEAFVAMGLVESHSRGHSSEPQPKEAYQIPAWQGRQFISDNSTKRTRAYRQRQKAKVEKERKARQKAYIKELEASGLMPGADEVEGTFPNRHSDAPEQNRTETETETEDLDLTTAWDKLKDGCKLIMLPGGYQAFCNQAQPVSLGDGQLVVSMPYTPNPRLLRQLEQANLQFGDRSPIKSITLTKREDENGHS